MDNVTDEAPVDLSNVTLDELTDAIRNLTCGKEPINEADYNTPLHIGVIFVILVAGLLGMLVPVLSRRFPKLAPHNLVIAAGKHVGTGVLIALSLIHLIVPANEAYGSPCLPENPWSKYPFALLWTLLSALCMHFIDTVVHWYTTHRAGHHAGDEELATKGGQVDHHGHVHGIVTTGAERAIGAYILEAALAAHSIIIGITVGIAPASDLRSLIPALAFHQFFEGLALATRLVDAELHILSQAVLVILYSVAAPVGMAIGTGIHSTFNENDITGLLVEGTFDAVSAGILLFVAFSQMLAVDLPRDLAQFKPLWQKAVIMVCLWIGASVMAIIGRWL